ncbi:hypothetical protein L3V82_03955 [Thiotrichales bacterium 19S3-7]|nr:hypothetical protein [Thiotrichales bacterium 19S3-7]MCF6801828.1 hypothetical protein [Thiotrichales bacterium 19S3-11]
MVIDFYINKIDQSINNQSISDTFEYSLQLGFYIREREQEKQAQKNDIVVAVTLKNIIKSYSVISINKAPEQYELYICALYEKVNELYQNALSDDNLFEVKSEYFICAKTNEEKIIYS